MGLRDLFEKRFAVFIAVNALVNEAGVRAAGNGVARHFLTQSYFVTGRRIQARADGNVREHNRKAGRGRVRRKRESRLSDFGIQDGGSHFNSLNSINEFSLRLFP
jgi:hypothetical protein